MTATDERGWNPGPVIATAARAARTLPVRVEFARQISQWRVRGVLLVLAILPIVIRLAFLIGGSGEPGSGGGGGGTHFTEFAQTSGVNFAAFVLVVTGGFLLTLVVALLFGDMIAGEASRSALKYLLTIPVSRARLLVVKVVVASSLLVVGIALLAGMSLLVGVVSYGTGGLQVPGGPELGFGESVGRLVAASVLIAITLIWASSLGTLLTVLTDAPLAAAGGVVIASILSNILGAIPDLGDIRTVLPTWNDGAFQEFFAGAVDYGPIADSVLSSLVYGLVFGATATWWFLRKNISS